MKETALKVIAFVDKIKGMVKWVNVVVDTLDGFKKSIISNFNIELSEKEKNKK